jgi:hypothetical protein
MNRVHLFMRRMTIPSFAHGVFTDFFMTKQKGEIIMGTLEIIIIVVVLFLIFGGGGYYWSRRR